MNLCQCREYYFPLMRTASMCPSLPLINLLYFRSPQTGAIYFQLNAFCKISNVHFGYTQGFTYSIAWLLSANMRWVLLPKSRRLTETKDLHISFQFYFVHNVLRTMPTPKINRFMLYVWYRGFYILLYFPIDEYTFLTNVSNFALF